MLIKRIKTIPLETILAEPDAALPYPTADDRTGWEKVPPELRQSYLAEGEKWLNYIWPVLSASSFLEFSRSGNRLIYETPHFERRRALGALVVAECLEGESRFLDDIVNGIWAISEESFWGVPAHNWSPGYQGDVLPAVENPYIDLFAAETAGLLAWTRYLLGKRLDLVSPLIGRRIYTELERRIIKPFLEHEDFSWMGYNPGAILNNWNTWIVSNLTSVFLLTRLEPFLRQKGILKLMVCTDRFLKAYPPDGGCDEGTTYWQQAGGSLFDTLDQLYHASGGQIDFGDNPLIKEIGRFIYRAHISGHYFINFADGAAIVNLNPDLVYRFGRYIKDKKMMGLAAEIKSSYGQKGVPPPLMRVIPSLFNHKELQECSYTMPFERDVWLPEIQVTAARQEKGSDKGLYLAAKGGHNGENHNHNDVGSCIVYLDGAPVIIDAGVGTYTKQTFSDQRYSLWYMQSAYHNLPSINGKLQQAGKDFTAKNVVYQMDEDRVDFGLDIQGAYPDAAGCSSYRREYTLCRTDEAWLSIKDTYCFTNQENTLSLYLMCRCKPSALEEGILSIPATENRALYLWYPKTWHLEVEHIVIDDKQLQQVWGEDGIYRVCLQKNALPATGCVQLLLVPGDYTKIPEQPISCNNTTDQSN